MTGFRGSGVDLPLRLAIPALALAILLGGAVSPAQPLVGDSSVGQPLQLLPPGRAVPPEPRPDKVAITTLSPLDGASIGLLDASEGGFGANPWRGAGRAEVAALIDVLPVGAPSAAMQELMRRVLVISAPPPEGPAVIPSLLGVRATKLRQLGRTEDLIALAGAGLIVRQDETATRAIVEALLQSGRLSGACSELRGVAHRYTGRFWQEGLVLCQAVAGEAAAARLGLNLLRERQADDTALYALAEALTEGANPALPASVWQRLRDPEPLLLAALAETGLAVPANAAAGVDDPGRLVAIATGTVNPPQRRIEAGERAVAAGAITSATLMDLYATAEFRAADLADAIDRATDWQGPRARALLVQAAAAADEPAEAYRHYELALALTRAENAPLGVFLALLDALPPGPEGAGFAADAARAYYAAGDLENAVAWHEIAASAGRNDRDRAALIRLWPLAVLAGAFDDGVASGGAVAYARNISEWLDAEFAVAGEAGTYSAAMTLAAFDALGEPIDSALWRRVRIDDSRDNASLPSAGLWWRMPSAAADGQVGLVALMALIALGDQGPAHASPALLERVLSAMVAAGLEGDARRLGREAIWASQL
ncbi:MAG: hypothetical protein V3R98_10675 [Alphaproteobacteria bacterium]